MRQPLMLADIDQPADSEDRVYQCAQQRSRGGLGLQLQYIVQENDGLVQICKDIPDSGTCRLGHDLFVARGGRTKDRLVERLVERKHRPVEPFEWIAFRVPDGSDRFGRCRRRFIDRRCFGGWDSLRRRRTRCHGVRWCCLFGQRQIDSRGIGLGAQQ